MLSLMPRDLDWEGCFAIRDLGGLPTPHGTTTSGVFVRGDNVRNLTASGWRQAADYGMRTVLDLRSAAECDADRDLPPGFVCERISLFAHFDDDPVYRADLLARISEQDTASKYRALYAEALDLDRAQFAQAFSVLAETSGGVHFHCVGGKDRTGVLAALVLRLVGVPMHDVEADYMHTEVRARGRAGSPDIDQSAPAGVISQVISELEDGSQSVGQYLLNAGASAADLAAIAEKFVCTASGQSAQERSP
jgi:hypothetical protein